MSSVNWLRLYERAEERLATAQDWYAKILAEGVAECWESAAVVQAAVDAHNSVNRWQGITNFTLWRLLDAGEGAQYE